MTAHEQKLFIWRGLVCCLVDMQRCATIWWMLCMKNTWIEFSWRETVHAKRIGLLFSRSMEIYKKMTNALQNNFLDWVHMKIILMARTFNYLGWEHDLDTQKECYLSLVLSMSLKIKPYLHKWIEGFLIWNARRFSSHVAH